MKFGIFYEHQLPRPWDADSEYRLLQESLDQIELAMATIVVALPLVLPLVAVMMKRLSK